MSSTLEGAAPRRDAEVISRVAASFRGQPGDALTVHVHPRHLHLFAADSGLALGH